MKTFWLISLLVAQSGVIARPYPPVHVPPNDQYGAGIQRTMTLLATSTPEHRNTVKILFYGQSITEQAWARTIADELRVRFPNANLIITNRAIGGYGAELLVRTAESDLFPFYPDLVIFQVYGSLFYYEELIRKIRERTTSEILLQTDHITKNEELSEETDPAKAEEMTSAAFKNYSVLPRLAREFGAELADIRSGWRDYLQFHQLDPANLLEDHIHLNGHGEFVMAELIWPHLVYRPDQLNTRWRDAVRTFRVGQDIFWEGGALELDFHGNRVDLILAPGFTGTFTNYLDDLPPSAHPGGFFFTRSSPAAGTWRPSLIGIGSETVPLLEDWTLTITSYDASTRQAEFRVEGSLTGLDGEGSSSARFVSNSGRIVLEPAAWGGARSMWWTHPAEEGFQITWSVIQQGNDRIEPSDAPAPGFEFVPTVIQGIPVGPHRLRIEGEDSSGVLGVRVFDPDGMVVPGRKPVFSRVQYIDGRMALEVQGGGVFQLEKRIGSGVGPGSWESVGEPVSDPVLQVETVSERAFFRVRQVE